MTVTALIYPTLCLITLTRHENIADLIYAICNIVGKQCIKGFVGIFIYGYR